MSQIATLPLKNSAGTAVSFTPVTSQKGDIPAEWLFKPTGKPFLASQRVTQLVERNSNNVLKVRSKISFPVVATDASNVSTLAGQLIANITISVPADIAQTDVDDFAAYVLNYASTAAFQQAIKAGDVPY